MCRASRPSAAKIASSSVRRFGASVSESEVSTTPAFAAGFSTDSAFSVRALSGEFKGAFLLVFLLVTGVSQACFYPAGEAAWAAGLKFFRATHVTRLTYLKCLSARRVPAAIAAG